jgi:hypothetical protein
VLDEADGPKVPKISCPSASIGYLDPVSFYRTRSSAKVDTPVPATSKKPGRPKKVQKEPETLSLSTLRRGRSSASKVDKNNNASDSDSEADLHDLTNPFYKGCPGKKKFDWSPLGTKGQEFLNKYYTGNKGPPE